MILLKSGEFTSAEWVVQTTLFIFINVVRAIVCIVIVLLCLLECEMGFISVLTPKTELLFCSLFFFLFFETRVVTCSCMNHFSFAFFFPSPPSPFETWLATLNLRGENTKSFLFPICLWNENCDHFCAWDKNGITLFFCSCFCLGNCDLWLCPG